MSLSVSHCLSVSLSLFTSPKGSGEKYWRNGTKTLERDNTLTSLTMDCVIIKAVDMQRGDPVTQRRERERVRVEGRQKNSDIDY